MRPQPLALPACSATLRSRLTAKDAPNLTGWNIDEAYTYDQVGNRKTWTLGATTRAYTYWPGSNRVKEVRLGSDTGAIEQCHYFDAEGRMTGIYAVPTGGTLCNGLLRYHAWDAQGRLQTQWNLSSGYVENYQYDPADQRIARRGGRHGDMDYYLEGEHLESVYSPITGEAIQKYFRGATIDELVAGWIKVTQTDANGTTTTSTKPYLFHQDELTSTRVVSGHNGGYQQWMTYTAFGQEAGVNTQANWLKYTGREEDGTGFYYYRQRYYDPYLGRFISEDPMGYGAGDVNFYAYVGNDPVNNNDPSGLVRWGDAGMASLNLASNAAGSFVGGTIAVTGAGLLAAPEPVLTKVGGVGAIAFGGAIAAKSVAGMGMNFNNLVRAIQDRPANMPGSLAEVIAGQIAPGNANAQKSAQIIDLGLDFATGRVRPDKMMTLKNGIPGLKWGTAAESIESAYGAGGKAFNFFSDTLQGTAAVSSILNSGKEIASYLNPATAGRPTMHSFEQLSAPGAAGSSSLYPSRSNTSMLQSVYRK